MAFTLEELYAMQSANERNQTVVDGSAADAEASAASESAGGTEQASEQAPESSGPEDESAEGDAAAESAEQLAEQAGRIRELEDRLQESTAENEILRKRIAESPDVDPFEQEMIDLLKAEVGQLQTELSHRDERIRELTEELSYGGPSAGADVNEEEVTRLVSRLEDLLKELDQKDEELAVLQQQLSAREEASHAEEHERQQLESWVNEIEDRVIARDREWETTVSELRMQLTQAQAERREAESCAGQADVDTRVETLQRVVSQLREEKDGLVKELEGARTDAKQLQRDLEDERHSDDREESVQLCQERAELARQRFEIEKLQREMAEQKAVESSDLRIRALRDHLKEVHHSEEQEKRERFEQSLAGRVSRLWRRLDSR